MATRFQLTEEDFQRHPHPPDGEDGERRTYYDEAIEKIPILKRRAAASATAAHRDDGDGGKDNDAKESAANDANDPICVIVVGMAGSGKTTLMAQLQKSLHLRSRRTGGDDDVGAEGYEAGGTSCRGDGANDEEVSLGFWERGNIFAVVPG